MIFTYVLASQPFVLQGVLDKFIPRARVGWEILTLAALAAHTLLGGLRSTQVFLCASALVFTIHLASVETLNTRTIFSTYAKIAFALLVANSLWVDQNLRRAATKLWVALGWYLAASALIFLGTYAIGVPFYEIERPEAFGLGRYAYHFNPLLGSHVLKNMSYLLSFPIPRFSSWMNEPGQLSFVYAFNTGAASLLINDGRKSRLFQWLNMVAGLSTLSFTYVVFLAVFTVAAACKWVRGALRRGYGPQIALAGVVGLAFASVASVALVPLVLALTSLTDRWARIRSAIGILKEGSLLEFFFGHGLEIYLLEVNRGFSNGILKLLIERGFWITILVLGMVWVYSRRSPLTIVVAMIFFLAFDLFPWPVFWLALAIGCSRLAFAPPARKPQAHTPPALVDAHRGAAITGECR